MKRIPAFCLLSFVAFTACRKKADPIVTAPANGNIKITAQNMVGSKSLALDSVWYQNEAGDSFTVSLYKYYISNVRLTRDDGTVFSEPESYHLVNEAKPETKSFIVTNVPPGNYNKITFLIGVDSAMNVLGATAGDLDAVNGMVWDWNTGYIAAKIEGHSPKSHSSEQKITFHIGGYKVPYQVMRTVTLSLPSPAVSKASATPNIHMKCDLLEWFKTPTIIHFDQLSQTMEPSKNATTIADNYADMFKVDHVD